MVKYSRVFELIALVLLFCSISDRELLALAVVINVVLLLLLLLFCCVRFVKTVKGVSKFSDLPNDLLTCVAKRLIKLEDYTSFTSVSKSFLLAANEDSFEGLRFRQHLPYMMLSVREGNDNDDIREVYSLVDHESVVASVKVPCFKRKACLESLGWLLVSDVDGNSHLLNPFSGIEIPLPHQTTFPDYDIAEMPRHICFFQKILLSAKPNETSDFVLIVIAGVLRELAFWRLGDNSWTKIHKKVWSIGSCADVVHYGGGKFYAFYHPGEVFVLNFSWSDNQVWVKRCIVLLSPCLTPDSPRSYSEAVINKRIYLLKAINGSLLLITRSSPCPISDDVDVSYISNKFQVYELDVVKGTWREIHSLGSMAVFLGHNSTIFLDASRYPGVVKPNHIYFTDDNLFFYSSKGRGLCGGYDSGVYNFETGTVKPVYPGDVLLSKVSPSLWITPCA